MMTFVNDRPPARDNALPVYPAAPFSQSFRLYTPASPVGTSKSHLIIFNGSTHVMRLLSLLMLKDATLAVPGAVAIDCFLERCSEDGTGGTLAVEEGISDAVPSVCANDPRLGGLPSGVVARFNAATRPPIGAVIARRQVHPEESAAASGGQYPVDFITSGRPLIILPGTGVEVYQGAVASVSTVIFDATFELD